MAEGSYLIGIDGDTESVRVGIFDQEGTSLVFSSEEYAPNEGADARNGATRGRIGEMREDPDDGGRAT